MPITIRHFLLAISLIFFALSVPSGATAETVADPNAFDGATIEYIVGSKPGGGYDRTTRLIAAHLGKHLPGSKVIVSNQPQAGGLVALNRIANHRPGRAPDAVLMFNSGYILAQIGGLDGMKVDLAALPYIGKATSEARFVVMSTASGITTFDQLLAAEGTLVFPAGSHGNAGYIQAALMRDIYGIDLRIVTGFGGSEARAGLAKGEIDGDIVSEANLGKLLKAGAAVPILRFGTPQNPDYAGVPSLTSVAVTEDQQIVARQFARLTQLGRVTATSPALGPEKIDSLVAAFTRTMEDPEFLADATAQDVIIDAKAGEAVGHIVADVLNAEPRFVDLVRNALDP